jgi:UDP-N-acetylmuramoyl-L-alanyl-D-glutamate--2,6-diaminopimelate ligase
MQQLGGGEHPLIVVDYAHTPDALEKALNSVRSLLLPNSELYCVFGCGGDRDEGKRPLMGRIASNLANHIVVTSDNPRSESPNRIIQSVMTGVNQEAVSIEDRAEAIRYAVKRARRGDLVLIAGKGHEEYQEIAGVKYPFSDIQVAEEALQGKAA